MADIKFTNFAHSQLAGSINSSATTLLLETGHGARFPNPTGGDFFYVTLENASLVREIVKVTARSTDTLTVVRAQDNTTAVSWSAGDTVALRLNAAAIEAVLNGNLRAVNNLSDLADAGTARTNLGGTTVGKAVFTAATVAAAQQAMDVEVGVDVQAYDADTAKTDVAQAFTAAQRGAITALTDGATITPDFAVANNFSVTLGGNRTLANPTNLTAGQSGVIVITQDGTGSRTLAYGSNFKFPSGTAPTLTTAASSIDVLTYYVESASRITARLVADVK